LSLAGGASGAAIGSPGAPLTANTAITLDEEEISDGSAAKLLTRDEARRIAANVLSTHTANIDIALR